MAEQQRPGATNGNGNGYARVRDIDRLREDHQREFDRLQAEVVTRFDRAHHFYSEAHGDLVQSHGRLVERVDKVESVIDQQRGARNLIYALIGSNVMLVAVSLFTILHFIGAI